MFGHRDVWDTIRLGLKGGSETSAAEATVLVMRYHGEPPMDFLPLAGVIVAACVNGVPRRETDHPAGNAPAERPSADPVTSPSSTPSGRSSAGRRKRSGA